MHRLVALMLVAGALGCAMRVRGAVRDAQNGRAIPNAYVSSDCYPNAVSTDARGRYELKTRWSSCTLTVFAPGYRTRVVPMKIEDTRYPQQDVVLWRAGEVGPITPMRRSSRR
jgi:hypothetical protein